MRAGCYPAISTKPHHLPGAVTVIKQIMYCDIRMYFFKPMNCPIGKVCDVFAWRASMRMCAGIFDYWLTIMFWFTNVRREILPD